MKKNSIITALFLLFFIMISHAQKIEFEGKQYHVKGDKFLLNKEDVTQQLTAEQKASIRKLLDTKLEKEKALKESEKIQKKAENKQKKAEKKAKNAEKELKKQLKAENNFSDAKKKYDKESKKYQKLKSKGKLSPEDEVKWLKKLENLQKKVEKTEKKL